MGIIIGLPHLSSVLFQKEYKGLRIALPEIQLLMGYSEPIDNTHYPTFDELPPLIYPDNETDDPRGMFRSEILIRVSTVS